MANVTIYKKHKDILYALITSSKVSSLYGATKSGPFKEQRDAYIFAVSIALAMNTIVGDGEMPKSKKDSISIRDSVFLTTNRSKEIIDLVSFNENYILGIDKSPMADDLKRLANKDLSRIFIILDRLAYSGFEWLNKRYKDEVDIESLIYSAIYEIEINHDTSSREELEPLLDFLL